MKSLRERTRDGGLMDEVNISEAIRVPWMRSRNVIGTESRGGHGRGETLAVVGKLGNNVHR